MKKLIAIILVLELIASCASALADAPTVERVDLPKSILPYEPTPIFHIIYQGDTYNWRVEKITDDGAIPVHRTLNDHTPVLNETNVQQNADVIWDYFYDGDYDYDNHSVLHQLTVDGESFDQVAIPFYVNYLTSGDFVSNEPMPDPEFMNNQDDGKCEHVPLGPATFRKREYYRLGKNVEGYEKLHQYTDRYTFTCAKCGQEVNRYYHYGYENHNSQVPCVCGFVPDGYNLILSASFSPVDLCAPGHDFTVTVVCDEAVNTIKAVNNTNTPMNNIWTKTANGDGTVTFSRTYTAGEREARGRYWTISAYCNNRAVGTTRTNSLDILFSDHELQYGDAYEESDTATMQNAKATISAILANQMAINQFNDDWNNITTNAGKMRFELNDARVNLSQSYTQKLIDYELDAMSSVLGKSATSVYEMLTDADGRIKKSKVTEFDRQTEIIKDQILLSMSVMPSPTDSSFYNDVKVSMEVLSLTNDFIFDILPNTDAIKSFLEALDLDEYVESLGKETSYVFSLFDGLIKTVDISRANSSEKSAYVALIYEYDKNMRYLDGLCECGVPQIEQASKEVRQKLQEAVEGTFYTTNFESASAHLNNIIDTMKKMGLSILLEPISHYIAALKIGGAIGGAVTKNTKDQIDSAQELNDLNNICSIVGSGITTTTNPYSLIELYSTLENSRIDTLVDLLQANGEGTLGLRQRDYSVDISFIEGDRRKFNQTIEEINKTLIQYTYDAMNSNQ